MTRAVLVLMACASGACGQLALFTVEPERPVGNLAVIGSVPAGDVLTARLRLRNTGAVPVSISLLSVAGSGFSLAGSPPLPYALGPGAALEFDIRFEPSSAGSYSASFRCDNLSAILVASATAAPVVSVMEGGVWRVLASGMTADFGTVERGNQARLRFLLANRSGGTLGPLAVTVSGESFDPPDGLASPVVLAPGQSAAFEVPCVPRVTGPLEGVLTVGSRRFILRAAAVEPPLPRPEIVVALAEAGSARQGRLSVRLESASRARATGEMRLEFEPAAPGLDGDPAITFASGSRLAAFSVEEGDTEVRFGAHPYLDFQTGSTAGTVVFTLDAPGFRERATVAIAPAPAAATSARASRAASSVEVVITGLDNTRTASQVTFTFYGKNGVTLPPGAIPVDCAPVFRQYFDKSGLGGVFLLRAVFPVSGDAGQIESVEAEITNSAGTGRTARLPL